MHYLDRDCVYDVSKLDPMWIEELFELLVFNDSSWNISRERNFGYVERILEGTSNDTKLYYSESADEWLFDSPDYIDTEYIDAVVDIEDVLLIKEVTLVEEIKFNSKRVVIL